MIEIKEGAIFLSDAHDNSKRFLFLEFLKDLDSGKIQTPQLFLMGDMFDLLVSEISYTTSTFKEYIDIINRLSKKIDILYFEGNHDFNLKPLFSNITIFPISSQPVLFNFYDKKILLSHGDIYEGVLYRVYTKIIRNSALLTLLNLVDITTRNSISKKILTSQLNKKICYKIDNFNKIIKQKLQKYDIEITKIDFVCEGHYHQNREFIFDNLKYKNFGSFACDKSYYKITFKDEITFKQY